MAWKDKTQWTNKQQSAISTPGNLIVSAAAGSGKTSVLTERICKLIYSGAKVENFLVLTFTRAAASEMKQRITDRLHGVAKECDDKKKQSFLLSQLSCIGTANISTIDSFCTRIVRRHGHTLSLDSNARIADELELAVISDQAKTNLFSELSSTKDADYHLLLTAFRSEDAVWSVIHSLSSFLSTRPFSDVWLKECVSAYGNPDYIKKVLSIELERMKYELTDGIELLTRYKESLPESLTEVISVLDSDLMQCRSFLMYSDYDAYREAILNLKHDRMSFPKGIDEDLKEEITKKRQYLKDVISDQKKSLLHPVSEESDLLIRSLPVVEGIIRITQKYIDLCTVIKRKKGILDFSDIEHISLELLQNPQIAEEYKNKFEYIFIDEYQDSNGVQEELINAIRRDDNLFLVGDVKQSIYRFRAAEPELFLEKLNVYKNQAGSRIDLNENFRSADEILDAVNLIFRTIMSKETGEINYDDASMLYPGKETVKGVAELHLIAKSHDNAIIPDAVDDEESESLQDMEDAEAEALFIGNKIKEIMAADSEMKYSDIAILLRSTPQAVTFAETLAVLGIPCYAQSAGGYFDAIEVMILLNCLRVIDNMKQDIPLISVLHSSLFHYSSKELARIRSLHQEGYYYEAFLEFSRNKPADNQDIPLFEKAKATCAFLSDMRHESTLIGITDLLIHIIDSTHYYELVGSLPAGLQRQRNIDSLIDQARVFEANGARGIWQFIHTIECALNNSNIGIAQETSGNVVRIISVHKSKGLEFPVVFYAQMAKQFNKKDSAQSCMMHNQLGIGIKYFQDGLQYSNAVYKAIRHQHAMEMTAEEMRVLYVGLTRAKRYLYMVGSYNPDKFSLNDFSVSNSSILNAKNPLAWIAMSMKQDPSILPVCYHNRSEFSEEARKKAEQETPLPDIDIQELKKAFAFQYPYADSTVLPAKQSVTQVIQSHDDFAYLSHLSFDPPLFVSGDKMSSAKKGSIVHMMLEHLPLKPVDCTDIHQLGRLLLKNTVPDDVLNSVISESNISWFSSSDLWKRACASEKLERERNFTDLVPASILFESECQEPILLQGTIDCCFVENGKWILVDYKTDHLKKDETIKEHAETHRKQLSLYARALEHLTGIPVSESYVVFLALKEYVKL